ncbi:MAG: rubrerythrin [Desulfobacterales bacterium]|nr:rubrerythrin [Desulfobacterales bacterium]
MEEDRKLRIRSLEEMIQVVLLAIPEETSAQKLYLSAAEKAVSEESKTLFLTLAAQEKGHEAELRHLLENLKSELQSLKS